ncbi:MAG: fibronectin type III domain-containing protein [Methanoregula sp.]|uniref:fibronectin type III domain-containing protein n=1 Tax=Methanoregula sp. TaxID=2052170 RepID=UPI003BAF4149
MTAKKKSLVFIIFFCCLLTVPVFLSGPAAGAVTSGAVAISGTIPLVTYNVSVSGIDWTNAIVTWQTNENANSTVEYGTTTSYGSLITNGGMTGSHTISLYNLTPGTVYHYIVISFDPAGNRAVSTDLTFTTTSPSPTVVPTPSGGAGGGGGGGRYGTFTGVFGPQQQQPGQPELPQQLPSQNIQIFQRYPAGFPGLQYNADGQGTFFVGIEGAHAAGAIVTIFPDRVEIYQHHSPGVLFTFWGNNLTINNGNITGLVSRAEFVTDPMNATLALGNVSGSVHAALPALIQPGYLNITITEKLSTDTLNQFQSILGDNGLQLTSAAYSLNVEKVNVTTGPANITFTIPASWVNQNGGKDAVIVTRISDETGKQELLDTVYGGLDTQGNMIFRGDSPNGTSLFGLVTAEAYAAEQKANPNVTYVGVSRSSMVTNLGMFGWLAEIILEYPVLLIGVIALLAVIVYFGWWKRKL